MQLPDDKATMKLLQVGELLDDSFINVVEVSTHFIILYFLFMFGSLANIYYFVALP